MDGVTGPCLGTGLCEAEMVRGEGGLLGSPGGGHLSQGDEITPLGFEESGDVHWVK